MNLLKKNSPQLNPPPPLAAQEPSLSRKASLVAQEMEQLEIELLDAKNYAADQEKRAVIAEKLNAELRSEYSHRSNEDRKELSHVRSERDHWQEIALNLRTRLDAVASQLLDILRPPPKAATIVEPPPGLEEALASPPEGEFHE